VHSILLSAGAWHLSGYAAFLGAAFLAGLVYFRFLEGSLAEKSDFWLLANTIVFSGIVGGLALAPFLAAPRESSGGKPWALDAHGVPTFGVLMGVIAGVCVFCAFRKAPILRTLDIVFLVVPLCHGIARFGCFTAGCCYGRPAGPSVPWAVIYRDAPELPAHLLGVPLHPTQLYEALGDLALAAVLYFVVAPRANAKDLPRGTVFFASLAGYGTLRFANDFFRGDPGALLFLGLTAAQLLSLAAIMAAAVFWTVNGIRGRAAVGRSPVAP
jgi:phosphatidylglycerol:prolipoprotein diacylglycerol transferase